jgi:hypothetical protein
MSRLGLSLFVMIGFWTNSATAQYILPIPDKAEYPRVMVVPPVPFYVAHHPPYPMPFYPAPPPPPARTLCERLMNRFGMNCNPNHDLIAGNLWENCHLVYGSSHDFFKEFCGPNQACSRRGASCGAPQDQAGAP